ncbi:hypothetical protein PRIPAC_82376 [Pristionchus pacificus]|nr:hypothetical protein PRIPAC_82376 [Pristionchus pacificus]
MWRNCMFFIQIWLIALDVHIDLLVQPVPLFPTFAAYGTGILCRLGVPLPLRGSLFGLLSVNQIWIAWHCIVVRNECSNMHSSMCVPSPSDHTKVNMNAQFRKCFRWNAVAVQPLD